eukprot:TRINITY_DN20812_c0_g1_i1.p1 TRINITY_DN20812_c0_g1~~TRINITY_DN20812_c0_g1_i1.p1  ORF type:complete len:370 (+),score=55.96 TRINITY_DN20812_c0_g1_i1:41-1150(+)
MAVSSLRLIREAVISNIPEITLCKAADEVKNVNIYDGVQLEKFDMDMWMGDMVALHTDHHRRLFCALSGCNAVVWVTTDPFDILFWRHVGEQQPLLIVHKHLEVYVKVRNCVNVKVLTTSLTLPYKQVKAVYSKALKLGEIQSARLPPVVLLLLTADTVGLHKAYRLRKKREVEQGPDDVEEIEELRVDALPSYNQSVLKPVKKEHVERVKEERKYVPPPPEIEPEDSYVPQPVANTRKRQRTPSPEPVPEPLQPVSESEDSNEFPTSTFEMPYQPFQPPKPVRPVIRSFINPPTKPVKAVTKPVIKPVTKTAIKPATKSATKAATKPIRPVKRQVSRDQHQYAGYSFPAYCNVPGSVREDDYDDYTAG